MFAISQLLTADERVDLVRALMAYEQANPIRVVGAAVLAGDPRRGRADVRVGFIPEPTLFQRMTDRTVSSEEFGALVAPLSLPGYHVVCRPIRDTNDGYQLGGDTAYREQLIRSRVLEAHLGMYGLCRTLAFRNELKYSHAAFPSFHMAAYAARKKGLPPPVWTPEDRERLEFESRLVKVIDLVAAEDPELIKTPRRLAKAVAVRLRADPACDPLYDFGTIGEEMDIEFALEKLDRCHDGIAHLDPEQARIGVIFADSVEVLEGPSLRQLIAEELDLTPRLHEEFSGS